MIIISHWFHMFFPREMASVWSPFAPWCHFQPRLGSFADQQFVHREFLELADEYMMKAPLRILGDCWDGRDGYLL